MKRIKKFLAAGIASIVLAFAMFASGAGIFVPVVRAQAQTEQQATKPDVSAVIGGTMVARDGTTAVTITQDPCTSGMAKMFLAMNELDPDTAKAASVLYQGTEYPGCWVMHMEPEPHVDVALEVQPQMLHIPVEEFSPK